MGIYINPNNDGFKESLNSKIYVDKSGMIEVTNNLLDSRQKCMCISRPRRFGKSMAKDLLVAYYSKGCDSKELFANLKIAQNPDFEKHLNKYNVISLNLPQLTTDSDNGNEIIDNIHKLVIKDLKTYFPKIVKKSDTDLGFTLNKIYEKTNDKFIVLIDEWDLIFREFENDTKLQERYVKTLRALFKDRPYIKLAYITGILPVKRYNTQSALNNFDEYSMVIPDKMAEYFGFTEEEVKALCKRFNRDFDEIKAWYDGYLMPGNVHLYNPCSIVKSMEGELESYWVATSSFEALRIPINLNLDGLQESIISLIGGNRCKVNVKFFQNNTSNFETKDEALTFLVHLGYLGYDKANKEVFIPNREIKEEFEHSIITSKWQEVTDALKNSENLLQSTWNCDEKAVAEFIEQAHMKIAPVIKYNNEEALRSVVSIAYYTAINYYEIKKEFQSGNGFADMVFIPYKNVNKPSMVIELKKNTTVESAIAQIKEKKYTESLEKYSGEILLVGITYDDDKKHFCKIERITKL